MTDWEGVLTPPSLLQAERGDVPQRRAYGARRGGGLAKDFDRYLKAELRPLSRWEQVRDFLLGSRYVHDEVTHGRRDVWMHPEDFEKTRAGDCEDHALWAWVQLLRLKWEVRFTVGRLPDGGHAWVTLYRPQEVVVVEATAKGPAELLLPSTTDPGYRPIWSVDGRLRFYAHATPEATPPPSRAR